jgi:hypothetical protein
MEKSPGGTGCIKGGEGNTGFSACPRIHWGLLAPEIGFHPARVGRVHLDGRVLKQGSQVDGKLVHCCLGGIIGQGFHIIEPGLRIAVQRQSPCFYPVRPSAP